MKHECCERFDRIVKFAVVDGCDNYYILSDEVIDHRTIGVCSKIKYCPWCGEKLEVKDD